ncbi:amidase signature enzyme [Lophium mytilinum]|uniref:Amidase signature enzyme n=1 Tax=Lophium mytilinum TaxID=390894 RepID=A0A6A6R8A6_9PEZI|nr:amidase signature enzyme [Lophium mytilinum]
MSVVFLPTGPPTVSVEDIHALASRASLKIPDAEAEQYRHLLNGLDATASQIASLPPYKEPRLAPLPSTLPRKWTKPSPSTNPLNAWSHRVSISSPNPETHQLAGKTVAVKDNVSVAGLPLTGGTFPELLTGSKEYPIPEIDAVVVSRTLKAGGTIEGSATCEHFSMSPLSFTSATGCVQNPWLRGFTTGGSSSGCAALVGNTASKLWRERHGIAPPSGEDEIGEGVDMAIGGDQGGSIRIPASYAGIYGLKPTHGLIPYTGIISLFPMIDHTGPMTTSLEDNAKLLEVLAGYDGMDARMTPETPLRKDVPDYPAILAAFAKEKEGKGEWTLTTAGKGLRIGVITEAFGVMGLSDEVKKVVQAAVEQFRTIGAEVEEVSIPIHLVGPSIWTIAARPGMGTYGMRNLPMPLITYPMPGIAPPAMTQESFEILNKHNPAVVNVMFNVAHLSEKGGADALIGKAMMHVTELRAAYDKALEDYDVLVTPVNPRVGSKHPEYGMTVEEKMDPAIGATLNTCQFNVTGHPALSMPCGWGSLPDGKGKLPVGMQLVAKRFDEESIFKAAAAWEVGGKGLDKWDGQ